ncbi:MAG: hypothetical protein KY461_13280 [Actinobacteria bacterium]|nr:hypothetical protein [Actinomycetota bacterium]
MRRLELMFTTAPRPSPDPAPPVARERSAAYGDRSVPAVLDRHLGTPIDELDEAQIRDEMAVNETALRRISARNAELASALVRRQAKRNRRPARRKPRDP